MSDPGAEAFPMMPTPITSGTDTPMAPEQWKRPADMLSGTTWALGIAHNEITGYWHWIAWKGAAVFGNPSFDYTWENQGDQRASSSLEAENAAVTYALEAELNGTYP